MVFIVFLFYIMSFFCFLILLVFHTSPALLAFRLYQQKDLKLWRLRNFSVMRRSGTASQISGSPRLFGFHKQGMLKTAAPT
jgi:hypothetical protein